MTKIFGEGKNVAVLLEPIPRDRERYINFDRFEVWADEGLADQFRKIGGVCIVTVDLSIRYIIAIDPRYDTEFVVEEIKAVAQEAALKAAKEKA